MMCCHDSDSKLAKCHACQAKVSFTDWYYIGPAYTALGHFLDYIGRDDKGKVEGELETLTSMLKKEIDMLQQELKSIHHLALYETMKTMITNCYSAVTHFEAQATTFRARSQTVLLHLRRDVNLWCHLNRGGGVDLIAASNQNMMTHLRVTMTAWAKQCKEYEDSVNSLWSTFNNFDMHLSKCKDWYSSRITDVEQSQRTPPVAPAVPQEPRAPASGITKFWERAASIISLVFGVLTVATGVTLACTGIALPVGLAAIGVGAVAATAGIHGLRRIPIIEADYQVRMIRYRSDLDRYHEEVDSLPERQRTHDYSHNHSLQTLQGERKKIVSFQGDTMAPLLIALQALLGNLQGKTSYFNDRKKEFEISLTQSPKSCIEMDLFVETMAGYCHVNVESSAAGNPIIERLLTVINFKAPKAPDTGEEDWAPLTPQHDHADPEVRLAALVVGKSPPTSFRHNLTLNLASPVPTSSNRFPNFLVLGS
jgi:hypothetical protein